MIPYSRSRFVVDRHSFVTGGSVEVLTLDFVNDKSQGFGVPAKTLFVENLGGGVGSNFLYYTTSPDGKHWATTTTLSAGFNRAYPVEDGLIIFQMNLWTSNAGCVFNVEATPGIWTLEELKYYIPGPIPERVKPMISFTEMQI